MAKKITIDIVVNGKMQKATVSAKKLRNALDGVDEAQTKTSKSSRDYERNTKGAAKTTSNSTKEFSKMAQGMGGLVGAYATVAASVFALSAAFNFFKQAADLSALTTGQEMFAARTGVSMKLMTANIQEATGGLVAFKEAAQAAAIGQAAGLTADQMERLGKVAKNAGTILGRDVTDSFNRLTRGAIKAEPELLDELGIIIRIDRAAQDYAATINKNKADLTQFEKTQAVVNAVLEQGSQKFEDVGDSVNQVAKFGAAFQDTFKDLSKPIAAVANFIAGAFLDSIYAVGAVIGILGLNIVKSFAPAGPTIKNTAQEGISARKRLMDIANKEATQGTAVKMRQGNFEESVLKQVERSAKAKTSTVINLSKMERREIERDVQIIRAQNLRMTMDGQNAFNRMITGWKIQLAMFQAEYGKTMGRIKAITAVATMAMSKLLGALSIAGLLIMFYELGKQIRKTFFISDALRAAEDGLDKITKAAEDQKKAIKEVEDAFKPATSAVMGFSRSFGLITNINLSPVRSQLTLLTESMNKFKNESGAAFDGSAALDSFAINDHFAQAGKNTLFTSGLFGKDDIPKTFGEFNDALKDAEGRVQSARAEFEKSTEGMGGFGKAIARVKADLGDLGRAQKDYNALNLAAGQLNLPKVEDMEGADIAKAALDGLTPSLELFKTQLEAMKGTGIEIDDFDDAKMKQLSGLIADANKEFKGMDPAAFQAAMADVMEAFEDTTNAAQEAIDAAARSKAAFKGIADGVSGFSEGAQKFMPKSSNFTGLLTSMKEVENNFLTLEGTISNLDTKTLDEITNMSLGAGMDIESQSFAKTLELVNKLRSEEQGILTSSITVQELRQELEKEREKLLQNQITLEHKLTEEKVRQQKALLGQPKIMKSLLSAEAKRNEAAIALERAQTNYTIEADKLELADENRKRELKNQLDLATANHALSEEELRVQTGLLPILREQRDLKLEMNSLDLQKALNAELSNQARIRKELLDLQHKQIANDNEVSIKEAKLKNPFFDDERARTEARLLLQEAALKREADQALSNFNIKMKEIDLEYKLIDAKNKIAILQFKAAAVAARASGGEENEKLAQLYDSLVLEQQALGAEQQNTRALTEAMAAATRDLAGADLDRFRRDAEATRKALEPLNQVLSEASGAFRTGLEDSLNAMFTSLHDKSMDLGETLKGIGRGLLQTIQEAVTKKMIVDPLLNALNLGEEDPTEALETALKNGADKLKTEAEAAAKTSSEAMKTGIIDGGNDVKTKIEQGGRTIAAEIREALRDIELRIKVECCEGAIGDEKIPGLSTIPATSAAATDYKNNPNINATNAAVVNELGAAKSALMPDTQPQIPGYDHSVAIPGIKAQQIELGPMSIEAIRAPALGGVETLGENNPIGGPIAAASEGGIEGGGASKGIEAAADATAENTTKLGEVGSVLGENILQTGLAVSALFGNSKAGQALQKVMLALNAGQMIMKLWTALNTKSEVANTAAIIANTAAVTASAVASGIPGGKTGLYPPLGYAGGGIAKGPTSGYPAILHGSEAVVPLPNGKDIPVSFKGNRGGDSQQNNVTVNVSVNNEGNSKTDSSSSDSDNGQQLGIAISLAVQKELQNQKRPGGILSPYGAT
jgi:hypothetical protein